ncbi:MAG: hypothetical protein AM1032_000134 [Mycoplasmataceae bacterium]|nr:MAG: hypothetical protein AM1032_000134 [Mycoplasmataceae bacterium]
MINLNILKMTSELFIKWKPEVIKRTLINTSFILKDKNKFYDFNLIKPSKIRKIIKKAQKKELSVLGKKMSSILGKFAIENKVKIWNSGIIKKKYLLVVIMKFFHLFILI